MADLQLTIRYRPQSHMPIYVTVNALKWLWLIILPSAWMLTLMALMLLPALKTLLYSQFTLCILVLVIPWLVALAIGSACTFLWSNCYWRLSRDNFILPPLITNHEKVRAGHIWSEVTAATVVLGDETKRGKDYGLLVLTLDTGKKINFELTAFDKSDLEQVLLAIEMWGTSAIRTPELIDYQTKIQNETKGIEQLSYTQMWEDELSRRFKATTFVPLEPGFKLQKGRINVIRQLAFGGLSAIYLVQKDDCDLYVLKEAVVPANSDPEVRRQAEKHLARESEMLAKLSHPHIARVVDYFVEDSRNYLLLEYINGQDLRQFVRQNGPQKEEKVKEWATQLADALQYLHSQNPPIIHRDLTPDNVVLRNDGSLVIIDFGAANEFIGTATGTLIGKQAYIAPEQLRGKANCRSDIYAYGATLFSLLTGRDPMPLSSCHPRAVLPDISAEVDNFVAQLTEPEEDKRVQNVQELMQKLAVICNADVVVATSSSAGSNGKHGGQNSTLTGTPIDNEASPDSGSNH